MALNQQHKNGVEPIQQIWLRYTFQQDIDGNASYCCIQVFLLPLGHGTSSSWFPSADYISFDVCTKHSMGRWFQVNFCVIQKTQAYTYIIVLKLFCCSLIRYFQWISHTASWFLSHSFSTENVMNVDNWCRQSLLPEAPFPYRSSTSKKSAPSYAASQA